MKNTSSHYVALLYRHFVQHSFVYIVVCIYNIVYLYSFMYSDENTSTVVTHVPCMCDSNTGENKFPFPQHDRLLFHASPPACELTFDSAPVQNRTPWEAWRWIMVDGSWSMPVGCGNIWAGITNQGRACVLCASTSVPDANFTKTVSTHRTATLNSSELYTSAATTSEKDARSSIVKKNERQKKNTGFKRWSFSRYPMK